MINGSANRGGQGKLRTVMSKKPCGRERERLNSAPRQGKSNQREQNRFSPTNDREKPGGKRYQCCEAKIRS